MYNLASYVYVGLHRAYVVTSCVSYVNLIFLFDALRASDGSPVSRTPFVENQAEVPQVSRQYYVCHM